MRITDATYDLRSPALRALRKRRMRVFVVNSLRRPKMRLYVKSDQAGQGEDPQSFGVRRTQWADGAIEPS